MQNCKIFIVYHKILNEEVIFKSLSPEYVKQTMIYYGVNDVYHKTIENKYGCDEILEYKLDHYNPFLQLRGYMETSAYLHIYNNNLHEHLDFVGIIQYDMIHKKEYHNLNEDTIYYCYTDRPIVENGEWNGWMFPSIRNIEFLLNSYNAFFHTNVTRANLERMPLSLFQTNIYPKKIFCKLCSWLNVLVNEVYPWSVNPPYETHWGVIGGFTERAIGLFNAIEIMCGCRYENLDLQHEVMLEKGHYGNGFYLNCFEHNVYSKYLEDITNKDVINELDYAMFKAVWNDNYAERLCINDTSGLKLGKNSNHENYQLVGFDILAEDPRLVYYKGKLYVVFICISIYPGQKRGIGISEFDTWNPVFLRVRDMPYNPVEKNWAPFVKNDELYFVYNYDPLIIIKYDLNPDGYCDVVFKQDNIELPINTNEPNILRGGSNLIPYKDQYYIGGCHDRMHYKNRYNHFTRIVILDVETWRIVYVSKPIMYILPEEKTDLRTITSTNILYHDLHLLIQDPISIMKKSEDVFYITVNTCDSISLLYEIQVNIPRECFQDYGDIGNIQNKVRDEMLQICNNAALD